MNMVTVSGACEDYEFDVAELVDHTLAPEKARIVSLHIAGCARCRRWRDEYAAMDARLARAVPRPHLPASFEWRLAARLRSDRGAALGIPLHPYLVSPRAVRDIGEPTAARRERGAELRRVRGDDVAKLVRRRDRNSRDIDAIRETRD